MNIWDELLKVYNMPGIPDEAMSIIGDVMLAWSESQEGDTISRKAAIDAPFKKFDMDTGVTWIPLEYIENLPSAQRSFSRDYEYDLISRQAAIEKHKGRKPDIGADGSRQRHRYLQWIADGEAILETPSAQPETCEGCKHLGKWENEVEYGYPSPCTRCKRRVGDNYER